MSGPLRSKASCWTCRVRRKKCDESRPHCSICESLSITCYGYGPKPEWMDNGEKERAVANSLKEIVKHTWRRKATTQSAKQRGMTASIAPKPTTILLANSSRSSRVQKSNPSLGNESSQDGADAQPNTLTESSSPDPNDHMVHESSPSIPEDESLLLMHFMDYVFPLQFPMYKPKIKEGGRGWLLPLVLRTKPLYHAALMFAMYHRRKTTLSTSDHASQVTAVIQQEKHLEACIKSLNQFSQLWCPRNSLGVSIAVIQMALFALFPGDGCAWQPHLRAATNMYKKINEMDLTNFGLTERSKTILDENLPLLVYEPGVAEEVANFKFVSSTLLWLDITHSITAGLAPRLMHFHSSVISPDSQTKLEDLMGCKNWVMIQIGRIAALHEQKTRALHEGVFGCTGLDHTTDDIKREIENGITQVSMERFTMSEAGTSVIAFRMVPDTVLVTYLFAQMATIYLHLVTFGFQHLEGIEVTVSEAMRTLQTQAARHLLPSLVAPLYIIGAVARENDEQFFRDIFSSLPVLEPSMKHREGILPVLEDIWRRRRMRASFAWQDTLDFTKDILLV